MAAALQGVLLPSRAFETAGVPGLVALSGTLRSALTYYHNVPF